MEIRESFNKAKEVLNNKAIKYGFIASSIITSLSFGCHAVEPTPSSLQTAFSAGLDAVKSDFMGFVGAALPVGLGIAGIGIAITLGWKFFKKIGK